MTVMLWQPAIYPQKVVRCKKCCYICKVRCKKCGLKHKVRCNFCDCVSYYICIIKMEVSACIELR